MHSCAADRQMGVTSTFVAVQFMSDTLACSVYEVACKRKEERKLLANVT